MIELLNYSITKSKQKYELNKTFHSFEEIEAFRQELEAKHQAQVYFTYREKG